MSEKNNRLFLSVSDEDLERLDMLREELGMNRSQYIRYVIYAIDGFTFSNEKGGAR